MLRQTVSNPDPVLCSPPSPELLKRELADDWECPSPETPSLHGRSVLPSPLTNITRDTEVMRVHHSEEPVNSEPRSRHLVYTNEDEEDQRLEQVITFLPVTSSTGVAGENSSIDLADNYTVSSDTYNEEEEEDDSSSKRILEVDEITISKEELSGSSTTSSLVSFSPALGCRVTEFPPGTVFPSSRLIRDMVSRLSRASNVAIDDGRRRGELATSAGDTTGDVRCGGVEAVEESGGSGHKRGLAEEDKQVIADETFLSNKCYVVKEGVDVDEQVVCTPSRVLEVEEDSNPSSCTIISRKGIGPPRKRTLSCRNSKNVEVSSTTEKNADSSPFGRSTVTSECAQSHWMNQNPSYFVRMKKLKSVSSSKSASESQTSVDNNPLTMKGSTTSQTLPKQTKFPDDKNRAEGESISSSSDILFLSCGITNKDCTKINDSFGSYGVDETQTTNHPAIISRLTESENPPSKAPRLSLINQSRRSTKTLIGSTLSANDNFHEGNVLIQKQLPGISSPNAPRATATKHLANTARQQKKTTLGSGEEDATKSYPRVSSADTAELEPSAAAALDNEDVLNKVYRRFVLVNYVSGQSDRASADSARIINTSAAAGADRPTDISVHGQGQSTALSASDVAHMYITEAERKITLPKEEVKRPMNMYMLYSQSVRAAVAAQFANEPCIKISARIAAMWRQLSEEQRAVWAARATEAREEHRRRFPGYRYNSHTRRLRKLEYQHARERRRSMFRVLPAPTHL